MRRTIIASLSLWVGLGGTTVSSQDRQLVTDLSRWRLIGRALGTTPREGTGLRILVDPRDAPTTLLSPTVALPAVDAAVVRMGYSFAESPGGLTIRVAWLSDRVSSRAAENCFVSVPVQIGSSLVAEARLRDSSCWSDAATIKQLAINFGNPGPANRTCVVHSVSLDGR